MGQNTTDWPPAPPDAYSRPIELRGLRGNAVNVRDVGDGMEVAVVRRGDTLHVWRAVCPHMGGPLGEATLCADGASLQCPWHGYVFDLESGRLRDNPNEQIMSVLRRPSPCFRPERTPKCALTLLAYRVVGEQVWVLRRRGAE